MAGEPCACEECSRYAVDRLRQIEGSIMETSAPLDEKHTREAAYIHRYGAAFRATQQDAVHRERVASLVKLAGIEMP
jgi:hypothetical protein